MDASSDASLSSVYSCTDFPASEVSYAPAVTSDSCLFPAPAHTRQAQCLGECSVVIAALEWVEEFNCMHGVVVGCAKGPEPANGPSEIVECFKHRTTRRIVGTRQAWAFRRDEWESCTQQEALRVGAHYRD